MEIIDKVYSVDGTVKYLLKLKDETTIETIFYPYSRISDFFIRIIFLASYLGIPMKLFNFSPMKFLYRHTDYYGVCVSSQIGCQLGCKFCATGKQQFRRNLEAQEMIAQVVSVIEDYQPKNIKKLEIVFAGMGEPLLNYENVVKAIKEFPDALKNYGIDEIYTSLMTVGIVPGLQQLIKDKIKLNLFLSLHATTEESRAELMPIATQYRIDDILIPAYNYQQSSGSRPARINYTLLRGINDSKEHAHNLIDIARKFNFVIQIKMFNSYPGCNYRRVSFWGLLKFLKILKNANIDYMFDLSKGVSSVAGCGQLKYYAN